MTGHELLEQALTLLNYTDPHGRHDPLTHAALYKRALPLINQIYADVWHIHSNEPFSPLASLSQTIPLPAPITAGVLPYGVAMLLAQTDGDADNQAVYALLYNQRRGEARTVSDRVLDRQPRPHFG